jgi:predicted 3-demethylubiquinone-9 3-methyltransferase (glyoxalase superfamily)
VPTVLAEMMSDSDRLKSKRAADAMMKMIKIDIAGLQAAFAGKSES